MINKNLLKSIVANLLDFKEHSLWIRSNAPEEENGAFAHLNGDVGTSNHPSHRVANSYNEYNFVISSSAFSRQTIIVHWHKKRRIISLTFVPSEMIQIRARISVHVKENDWSAVKDLFVEVEKTGIKSDHFFDQLEMMETALRDFLSLSYRHRGAAVDRVMCEKSIEKFRLADR